MSKRTHEEEIEEDIQRYKRQSTHEERVETVMNAMEVNGMTIFDIPPEIQLLISQFIGSGDITKFLLISQKYPYYLANSTFNNFYHAVVDSVFKEENIIEEEGASCELDKMKPKRSMRTYVGESCNDSKVTKNVLTYLDTSFLGAPSDPPMKKYYRLELTGFHFYKTSPKDYLIHQLKKGSVIFEKADIKDAPLVMPTKDGFDFISTKDIPTISELTPDPTMEVIPKLVIYPCGCIPVKVIFSIKNPIADTAFGPSYVKAYTETKFISKTGFFTIGDLFSKIVDYVFDKQPEQKINTMISKLQIDGYPPRGGEELLTLWKSKQIQKNYKERRLDSLMMEVIFKMDQVELVFLSK